MRAALAIAFLVVPLAEIWLLIQVGQAIGGWQTVLLLLVLSAFGAWLVRREGRRTWAALDTALRTGRLPGRELADAALVLVGGTLLLTPGFLTDIVGAFFILPPTRPLARRLLGWFLARRVARGLAAYGPGLDPFGASGPGRPGGGAPGRPGDRRRGGAGPVAPGEVVQGEVVDPDGPGAG